MAGPIRLEIVTPEKIVVSEDAQIVMAPGVLGEFGVLIGHTPFLTALKAGAVRYTDAQGSEHLVFVSGGFAEALPDRVTILAESAERRRDIDVERARAALERAQKRLAEQRSKEEFDFVRAQAALQRAIMRLKVVEYRSQH
jgi:F-type H+-transporting ATPase subunit epsilon